MTHPPAGPPRIPKPCLRHSRPQVEAGLEFRGTTDGSLSCKVPATCRPGGGNVDEGTSVRLVEASGELLNPQSGFNVYVAAKSKGGSTGFDFAAIKYGQFNATTVDGNQVMRWDESLVPYYNFAGGDDMPVEMAPQYIPYVSATEKRRLFFTGPSWGGSTADDWATQFVLEQLP